VGMKASTQDTYQYTTQSWIKWCREEGIYPTDLTATNILDFITDPDRNKGKGLARASQVREKSLFMQILSGMESEGANIKNQLWTIHRFRPEHGMGERRKHRNLETHEIKAILEAWSGDSLYHIRTHAIISLMLASAIRSDEATSAEWSDIDLGKQLIFIPDGKGGVSRYAPILTQTAIKSLRRLKESLGEGRQYCFPPLNNGKWGNDQAIAYDTLEEIIKLTYLKTGIRIRLHDLRHTGLTGLYRKSGKDISLVQQVAGHASITTSGIYTHAIEAEEVVATIQLDW
jgi:integrase